jgi:pyruvate,water dikinase
MPEKIASAVKEAYRRLSTENPTKDFSVAVRSSATAEDLPDASFAGQQETYLNVQGTDALIEKTVKCWSSLFTPRAIFYRTEKGFKHEDVLISVGIQKMVDARSAGVMFTINPVTGDKDQIVIEGTWGLGEAVVSGSETPDHFLVNKTNSAIIERRIVKKTTEYKRNAKTGETEHVEVPLNRRLELRLANTMVHRRISSGQ